LSDVQTNLPTIEVIQKESRFKFLRVLSSFGVVMGFILGLLLILGGILMCLTIILILPGLGFCYLGAGVLYATLGNSKVECPNCGKKATVSNGSEDFKCKRCNQAVILKWVTKPRT